jgi:aspartyl-tRNA(Asn)/glutamyl-tRNA(Gln) amidotransferase subunit B
MAYSDFEAVIGLEIHAQLFTQSKVFTPASTAFGSGDNDHVTPVCAGMPAQTGVT